MKCNKCGFDNIDSANYCINCGTRMDGKITCPKCGELLSPEADVCHKCGKKIPHLSNSDIDRDATRQEKLKRIFTLIFNIVIIVAFGLSLLLVWGKYVSQVNSSNAHFGFAYYYLFLSWNDMFNLFNAVKDSFIRIGLVSQTIIQFIAVLFNVVISYVFAIKGIVKTAKHIKNKDSKCDCIFNVAMILVSNIITYGVIYSSSYNFINSSKYVDGGQVSYLIWFLIGVFILSIVFHNILISHKKEIMNLVERLLFATTFIFAIFALYCSAFPVASVNGNDYGSSALFFELMKSFGKYGEVDRYVATFVLSICLYCFKFLLAIFIVTFIIYFIAGYYSNKETRMSFKIPCYSLVLVSFIISLIILGLNIAQIVLLNDLSYISNSWVFGPYSWVCFALSFIAFGGAISSLVLNKKINRNLLLAEQTTRR